MTQPSTKKELSMPNTPSVSLPVIVQSMMLGEESVATMPPPRRSNLPDSVPVPPVIVKPSIRASRVSSPENVTVLPLSSPEGSSEPSMVVASAPSTLTTVISLPRKSIFST